MVFPGKKDVYPSKGADYRSIDARNDILT